MLRIRNSSCNSNYRYQPFKTKAAPSIVRPNFSIITLLHYISIVHYVLRKKPIDYDEVRESKQFFSLTLTTVLLFPAGWSIEVEWVIVSKNIFQFYGAVVLQYISIGLYSENKIA